MGAVYTPPPFAVFYQCKPSSCLDHARVVQGDRCALAEATVLLLYWAVQCRPNEHFIELIQALDEDMQLSIMSMLKMASEQIDEQGALLRGSISICELEWTWWLYDRIEICYHDNGQGEEF